MKVSIIIPNYNGEKFIKGCLDSLSRQSFKDFEIIIVDNGSKDRSISIIKKLYTNVTLIELIENYGFSKAVNEGIKISKGEYVVLLNNDTVVEEDWLSHLVNCIESDKKIFSCCSKMIMYNERNKIDDAGDFYTILGWTKMRGKGEDFSKYSEPGLVFSSCAGAAIYRKKILDEIGYFDENFFAYVEDLDICYRAKIYGYKNYYCSRAIVYHIGSATSGSRYNSFKVRLAARNNVFVIYKNMPVLQIIINLPFLAVGYFIKVVYFTFKGLGKEYLQGLKDGFSSFRKLDKVKYSNMNLFNYVKIEAEIIANVLKLF